MDIKSLVSNQYCSLVNKASKFSQTGGFPVCSDFSSIMNLCDMVALPYAEVIQSSSGPAAIALDLGMPILCSRNRCFTELEKFAKNCLTFFEISNHLEFARKTKLVCETVTNNAEHNQEYRNKYNVETRAQLYRKLCDK